MKVPSWLAPCAALALTSACADPLVETTTSGGNSSGETTTGDSPGDSSSGTPDPSTSSGSTTSSDAADAGSESSTGPGEEAVCGDGVIEGEETCDDGNTDDGDACLADCRVAFEIAYTQSVHIGDERPYRVVVDAENTAWVTGWTYAVGTASADPLLLAVAEDGSMDAPWTPPSAEDDAYTAAAFLHSGDIVLAGWTAEPPGGVLEASDASLTRVDLDGFQTVWTVQHDGPGTETDGTASDTTNDVVTNDAGEVFVSMSSGDIAGYDIRIASYDADGALRWAQVFSGPGQGSDRGRALALAPDGGVVFGGWYEGAEGLTGALGRLSDQGEVLALETDLPEPVNSVAVADDGTVVLVGFDWIERRGAMLDEVLWREETPGFDSSSDVALTPQGFAVVGTVDVVGEQANIFVGAWSLDGQRLWSDTYNNREASLQDVGRGIAVGPDGSVVIVGMETVIGQENDLFIRRYVPMD